MKPRMCNVFGCKGEMRPTRKMWDFDGKVTNSDHRTFRCVICGKENPWLDKPKDNSSAFANLHITKDGMASGLSMMSDPVFTGYKRPERKRR